ncbi:18895_t:CDS:10 [Gigaspora margarita]|uniref:18895_t:CDS:1 n=1 Tax=Gigaspora margarita TaxID=4874 RepID=A0ABN7UVU2_GIGMA|nr:18895_t:CDS:10 [Gigaspora margarita]
MGFLEKNKPLKSSKTPISINPLWCDILETYIATYPLQELHESIQKLSSFFKSADTTWEQQCQYLRAIEKSLPSKKSICNSTLNKINLSSNFTIQIESVLEPIIVGIYFTSIEPLAKQRCIPIFDSCYFLSTKLPSNHNIESIKSFNFDSENNMALEFSKEYSKYITHDNYTTQTLCQKDCLMIIIKRVKNELEENNVLEMSQNESKSINDITIFSNSLIFSQHMNDAQHVIKTLLALLSRFENILRPKFELIKESYNDNSIELSKIKDLLNGCITICSDEIYIKDVRQLTGMTLAAILNLLGPLQYVNDLVLSLFFVWPITREQESLIMSLLRIQTSTAPIMEHGWQGEYPTMLVICRGLLSNLSRACLIHHISNFKSKISVLSNCKPSSLHHILFLSITYFCDNAITSQMKITAFETMGMWLQETEIILRDSNVENKKVLEIQAIFDSQSLDKLMSYVWNNCDDPVDAIQYKVKTIFEKLLDILSIKRKYENTDDFYNQSFNNLLKQLLLMDPYRKVKYVLLLLLLPRVGTNAFLKIQADFVWRTLEVLHNTTIAPRSSQLLATFFEQSLKELLEVSIKQIDFNNEKKIISDTQKEAVTNDWINIWLAPVCHCLTSSNDTLRKNIGNFILKPLFKIDPLSFWRLLNVIKYDNISNGFVKDDHFRLNALITITKVARSLDLVDGKMLIEDGSNLHDDKKIKLQSLRNAIYHIDPNLRIDVLGLISESQKSITEVTSTELSLLKSFFELNLNSTSPEFRQKMCGHLNKLFSRLQGNLYAQWRDYKSLLKYVENNSSTNKNTKISQALLEAEELKRKIDISQNFLNWLIELLVASLYPGASFQRVSSALKIFIILIKTFGLGNESSLTKDFVNKKNEPSTFPFQLPLAVTRNVKLILNCLMNPFDENRMLSYEILEIFPSPLPGIESIDDVQEILFWAFQSMTSTRAGESDSGATIFSLIFSKYVLKLGYDLDVELDKGPPVSSLGMEINDKSTTFIGKLMVLLEKQINIASQNLLLASQKYPMHGTLLALQYIFKKLDYNSTTIKSNLTEWQFVHDKIISLINQVCQIVLEVLSNPSPEGNVPASFQEMEETIEELVFSSDDGDVESEEGPKHQVILSCCWRTVKEASALLAVILSRAPMATTLINNEAMLNYEQVRNGGALFRTLLTSIRHRGAFSAVYPGYVSVCSRLLDSSQIEFAELPKTWLKEDICAITTSSISITRRSAGLPLCILAIVNSEPSTQKTLLPWAMKILLNIGSQKVSTDDEIDQQTVDLPQVHAFNILRTIFMDAKLGADVLPHVSDGFMLAINGFCSSRTFGTKKTKDEHHSINQLTSREFFSRFPKLHPFLVDELTIAVNQLIKPTQNNKTEVHPGLYPILTLLSRLHPSLMESSVLNMDPFVTLVKSCCSSPIYKAREMSARSLVPLIASQDLIITCTELFNACEISNQNELHGRLVQIQYLMRGHLSRNLTGFDLTKEFINKMELMIMSKIPVICYQNPCDITKLLFLEIMNEFVFDSKWILNEQDKRKQSELITLMEGKFAKMRQTIFDLSLFNLFGKSNATLKIGNFLARQQMAKVVIKSLLSQDISEKNEIIVKILSDEEYEVRLIALETFFEYFLEMDIAHIRTGSITPIIQSKLIKMIFHGEQYPKCFQLIVELLVLINSNYPFPKSNLTSSKQSSKFELEEFWKKLVWYMEKSKSSSIIEATLPLLGALTAEIWDETSLPHEIRSLGLKKWAEYINRNTKPEITLTLREAATKSLQLFSRLLFKKEIGFASNDDIQYFISLYIVLIRLTQDDDIDLRRTAALIVSEAMSLEDPVGCDRARELCYEYMTNQYSGSLHLYVALLQILTGDVKPDEIIKSEVAPSRVLFAIENPNIYKEDLVDIQLAYKYLRTAIKKERNRLEFPDVFRKDIPRFCVQQLGIVCESASTREVQTKKNGPLGFTSLPNVFTVIYRVIITVLAMIELVSDTENVLKDVRIIIDKLIQDKLQLHPLLNDLLFGELSQKYFNTITKGEDKDGNEFMMFVKKEFEKLFLLTT